MPRITAEEQAEWVARYGGPSAARLEAKASRSAPREDREHEEQVALMEWAALAAAALPELALLFAIPNGGARSKKTAGRLKAEGVKRGVPDLCLPVARHGFHGMYVELKAAGGHATPAQLHWHRKLRAQGYRVAVCFGWVDAKGEILAYLETTMTSDLELAQDIERIRHALAGAVTLDYADLHDASRIRSLARFTKALEEAVERGLIARDRVGFYALDGEEGRPSDNPKSESTDASGAASLSPPRRGPEGGHS